MTQPLRQQTSKTAGWQNVWIKISFSPFPTANLLHQLFSTALPSSCVSLPLSLPRIDRRLPAFSGLTGQFRDGGVRVTILLHVCSYCDGLKGSLGPLGSTVAAVPSLPRSLRRLHKSVMCVITLLLCYTRYHVLFLQNSDLPVLLKLYL